MTEKKEGVDYTICEGEVPQNSPVRAHMRLVILGAVKSFDEGDLAAEEIFNGVFMSGVHYAYNVFTKEDPEEAGDLLEAINRAAAGTEAVFTLDMLELISKNIATLVECIRMIREKEKE